MHFDVENEDNKLGQFLFPVPYLRPIQCRPIAWLYTVEIVNLVILWLYLV